MNIRSKQFKFKQVITFFVLLAIGGWLMSSALLMVGWNALAPVVTFINAISFSQALLLSVVFFMVGAVFKRPRQHFKRHYFRQHCQTNAQ